MKFKLLTLCSVLMLMTQSFHAASDIQKFVTNLISIYHKNLPSKQKKFDFEEEFKKFIADGGNLNEMFIDPETGMSTTPLFFCINNQLLYFTYLSLKYGADPLHQSFGGKSSINYVVDKFLHDCFISYMASGSTMDFAQTYEQDLRIINFALLLSYVPKDKRKQIMDDVVQKIVHECQVHKILIDELIQDYQEDFSEWLAESDAMKKEFKDEDCNAHESRLLIAFDLLVLEAQQSIFYMYLWFLPEDEQVKYLQDLKLPKSHPESLEKSEWFQYVAEHLLFSICA